MTVQESLAVIFKNHTNVWLTTKKIKSKLKMYGHDLVPSNFNKEFIEFRESFVLDDKKVLKVKMLKHWVYVLSSDKRLIFKHNSHLSREISKRKKRIINV